VAAVGVWAQDKLEPVVPDAIDEGEKPFIKPFMIQLADDHYALDISARRSRWAGDPIIVSDELPKMIAALKRDPLAWYKRSGLRPPQDLAEAAAVGKHPEGGQAGERRALPEGAFRYALGVLREPHARNLAAHPAAADRRGRALLRWTEIAPGCC
jgi:hypothetical protein